MKIAPPLRATKLPNKAVFGTVVRPLDIRVRHCTSCGVDSFEASATATVLLGSIKGMAASKTSTSVSVSTAGNKRKAPSKLVWCPDPSTNNITACANACAREGLGDKRQKILQYTAQISEEKYN